MCLSLSELTELVGLVGGKLVGFVSIIVTLVGIADAVNIVGLDRSKEKSSSFCKRRREE